MQIRAIVIWPRIDHRERLNHRLTDRRARPALALSRWIAPDRGLAGGLHAHGQDAIDEESLPGDSRQAAPQDNVLRVHPAAEFGHLTFSP